MTNRHIHAYKNNTQLSAYLHQLAPRLLMSHKSGVTIRQTHPSMRSIAIPHLTLTLM